MPDTVTLPDFIDGFWAKLDRSDPAACWEWPFARLRGYGRLTWPRSWGGGMVSAHRLAFSIANPDVDVDERSHVCHSCDNPPCCNPAHLWLGSPQENKSDAVRKKRHARGETHGRARLTATDVSAMREKYAAGGVSMASLALEFGISPAQAGRVIRGEHWAVAA